MLRWVYDLALFLLLLLGLPKFLWDAWMHKKYRSSWKNRFGFEIPTIDPKKKVFWMHGVSMGEVRAMGALFLKIQASFPEYEIVISTTTETGMQEAKKILQGAAFYFILPFDFSWVVRRVMKKIHPSYLIFCESDFWYNTLFEARKQGAKTALINGKISERSFVRFSWIPLFSQSLFQQFDTVCAQSEEYGERFLSLGARNVHVTGNLKLEIPVKKMSPSEKEQFQKKLGIDKGIPVVVIGSSHDPEEKELLQALSPLWEQFPSLKIVLVPRHKERFSKVQEVLSLMHFNYSLYSDPKQATERIVLIDAMGLLTACYEVATLAIVAGSYTKKVGGHNIFEPIQQGAAVFFGPYMHTQKELRSLVLKERVGREVPLNHLCNEVASFLSSGSIQKEYKEKGALLVAKMQTSVQTTFEALNLSQ